MRRNLEFERDATRLAARGLVNPESLIAHAETRALVLSGEYVTDPMEVAEGRDRARDVREELADARNHLIWHIASHLDDDRVPRWLSALRAICVAYNELIPTP